LYVRNLDAARAKREREIDHVADPLDVGPVHHRVDREQEVVAHGRGRQRPFFAKCAPVPGDAVGGRSVAVLDRDLHMVEASFGQCAEGLLRDAHRRGDEIGVKTGDMGAGGKFDEITPHARLAARQMQL